MPRTEIPRDLIVEALENAGFDEDNIYRGNGDGKYPGRYGVKDAVGIVISRYPSAAMRFAFELGRLCELESDSEGELYGKLSDLMDCTNTDNMGRDDDIYYWGNTVFTS